MDYARRFPDRQAGSNHEPLSVQFVRWGAPIDLTAAAISFTMRDSVTGSPAIVGQPGIGGSNGIAEYAPTLAELAVPGEYGCQFTASWPDGRVERSAVIWLRLLPNVAGGTP